MTNPFLGTPALWGGATIAASGEVEHYPASQLLTPDPTEVWRAPSRDEIVTVTMTLPRARKVPLVVFGPHNLSIGSKYRVSTWQDHAGGALVATSGWLDTWGVVYTASQVDWAGGNWWGRRWGPEEIKGYPWWRWWRAPGNGIYSRVVQVEFDNRMSADEYLQVGMIVPFGLIELPNAYEVGAQYGHLGRSVKVEADGGTRYGRKRAKPRVFRGVVPYMARDIALGGFADARRTNDDVDPMFWCPDPGDVLNEQRLSFLCTFENGSDLQTQAAAVPLDGVPLNLIEVI